MPKPRKDKDRAKEDRLDFCALCIASVMPGVKEDRQPKRILFRQASMWGMERTDRPYYFRTFKKLLGYIKNHWKVIRLMLPENHDILPCYVNGLAFGGGGYHAGNAKLAAKQVIRDAKVAQGVVDSADAFASATNNLFPQVAAPRVILSTRAPSRS